MFIFHVLYHYDHITHSQAQISTSRNTQTRRTIRLSAQCGNLFYRRMSIQIQLPTSISTAYGIPMTMYSINIYNNKSLNDIFHVFVKCVVVYSHFMEHRKRRTSHVCKSVLCVCVYVCFNSICYFDICHLLRIGWMSSFDRSICLVRE